MSNSYEENKQILFKLLKANTTEEVKRIIEGNEFFKDIKWLPYGGFSNNVGTVEGQMRIAENALIEKISNSIDAILLRKCLEEGIDPRDKNKAPKSMDEAIQRYFGGKENLKNNRSRLAKELLWLVADGKKERPTLTIMDAGEGQQPNLIKSTIVDLHGRNKSGIPFVYGKYNQGGSSALGFTGNPASLDEDYLQLVLCRRAALLVNQQDPNCNHFGFTLVRKRFDRETTSYTYEYLTDSKENIFSFPFDEPIDIYGYKFKEGCVIRLYEYNLSKAGNIIFKGLNYTIENKLAEIPLPMYMLETRDYRGDRDYSIFGLKEKLANKKEIFKEGYPMKVPIDLGSIGKREANVFLIKHKAVLGKEIEIATYLEAPDRIYFLKDGMALHTETMNWLRNQCDLPDISPYLYIFIDISNMDPALAQILHSGREGFKQNETTRQVLERLKIFLTSENFKQLNKEYAKLTGSDEGQNTAELTKQLIKDISSSPELRELFETGEDFTFKKEETGTEEIVETYKGSYLPEKFDLIGLPEREVEESSYARVTFETNAEDGLFERSEDRGEYDWSASQKFDVTFYGMKQGKVTFRIDPKPNSRIGEQEELSFYLKVPSKTLQFEGKVMFKLNEKIKYVGKHFPTYFNPIKKAIKVPVKSNRMLRLETDAENDYLSRAIDKGICKIEVQTNLEFSKPKLKNGILAIKVTSLKDKVQKLDNIKIEIQDTNNTFKISVPCEVVPLDTNPSLRLPKPTKIHRGQWKTDTLVWDELLIARIPSWKELSEIKINVDSKPFDDLKMQNLEDKEKALEILFRQIYVNSIWLFFEFKDLKVTSTDNNAEQFPDPRDLVFDRAIKANAKYILQNLKKFL